MTELGFVTRATVGRRRRRSVTCGRIALALLALSPSRVLATPLTPTTAEADARNALAARLPGAVLVWFRGSSRDGGDIMFSPIADFSAQTVVADGSKYTQPRWSPDGTQVIYGKFGGGIWLTDPSFDAPVEILPNAEGAAWTRDGTAITAIDSSNPKRVLRHDVTTGSTTVLYDSGDAAFAGGFGAGDVLADDVELRAGDRFLVAFTRDHNHVTYVIDLEAKSYLLNTWGERGDCSPAWAPDGSYIIHTERTGSRPVARSNFDASGPTLSEADHFILMAAVCQCDKYYVHSQRISNDGKWLVMSMETFDGPLAGGGREIWIWEIGTPMASAVRLTFDTGTDYAPSLWVPTDCPDGDGDGYGVGSGCQVEDCNDANGDMHPGAVEACNGADDDCDGDTDETWPLLGDVCSAGVGACRSTGVLMCDDAQTGVVCDAVPKTPAEAEICINGIDDDCDGSVDGGCPCGTGEVETCYDGPVQTAGVGTCTDGNRTCGDGAWGTCEEQIVPRAETCDGLDDDCDGDTDEDWPQLGDGCEVGVGACAATGTVVCAGDGSGSVCDASPHEPATEICGNGIDENCDGSPDDGCDAPGLELLAPVGGEVWEVGTTQTIRWRAAGIDDVTLRYSCDDGASWSVIAPTIDDQSPHWGAYDWVVPDEPSVECRVLVEDYFLADSQMSAGTFTIRAVSAQSSDEQPQAIVATFGCRAAPPPLGVFASAGALALLLARIRRRR